MALIPPDAGIRMRLQGEIPTQPQPVAPLPEIPFDLPELAVGQAFTARIQEEMPQNVYKALVAGKMLTLQLPEGAKTGDTLELVVVDRTPRLLIAQLAPPPAQTTAPGEPYPHATFSRAAQLIGSLLLQEGEAPQPAPLNRGQPLLSQPPLRGSELVPALAKAVSQSGMFYEAHQAQWVAGQMPLEQLLQEPQAQRSAPAVLEQLARQPAHEGKAPAAVMGNPTAAAAPADEQRQAARAPTSLLQPLFGAESRSEAASTQPQATALAHSVPEEFRPLVQQQLDAVATQRLVWHGEAWPNQHIEWEIVNEDGRRSAENGEDDVASWRTTLKLDTPGLGHVDASLRLTPAGLQMNIATPLGTTAARMQGRAPELAASLEAAGVTLLSFAVKHEPPAG
jgi:hypothetical protein